VVRLVRTGPAPASSWGGPSVGPSFARGSPVDSGTSWPACSTPSRRAPAWSCAPSPDPRTPIRSALPPTSPAAWGGVSRRWDTPLSRPRR
jgi:hypothetical protein